MNEEYLLPDDYVEEDQIEEVVEEETLEEAQEEVADETEVIEETTPIELLEELEVKFLHDTKKLKDFDKEEIKALVQKGMNHDRLLERVTIANERSEKIKELADLYGMSETDMLSTLYDQYFTTKAEQEGKDKDYVKLAYESNKKQAANKMYERFLSTHSGIKVEDIPQEVWQDVQAGEDLSKAYDAHVKETKLQAKDGEVTQLKNQIEELKKQIEAKATKEEVKKKAVVKATANGGNETIETDDFLSGFFGN